MGLGIVGLAIARLVACCLCLVIAYGLAHEDKSGWGWFLFVALCLGYFNVKVE